MSTQADQAGLNASRREAVDARWRYLIGHLDQFRYDIGLAAGWPIAIGAVEGTCRHLIGDRPDTTGTRWGLIGAEAVLRLRTLIGNGDFDSYWRHHTAREHERPHTAPGQKRFSLTV
ncbi:hypothetical protein [Streptomyces longispororuber]|uniref:hypothetical protein n=1 Tax=Streptomyces longispororuber TaxID=68230 RepID=UPI0036F63581